MAARLTNYEPYLYLRRSVYSSCEHLSRGRTYGDRASYGSVG